VDDHVPLLIGILDEDRVPSRLDADEGYHAQPGFPERDALVGAQVQVAEHRPGMTLGHGDVFAVPHGPLLLDVVPREGHIPLVVLGRVDPDLIGLDAAPGIHDLLDGLNRLGHLAGGLQDHHLLLPGLAGAAAGGQQDEHDQTVTADGHLWHSMDGHSGSSKPFGRGSFHA